ncbi:hypothetical protein EsHS_00004954 [Epichloe bromicola]
MSNSIMPPRRNTSDYVAKPLPPLPLCGIKRLSRDNTTEGQRDRQAQTAPEADQDATTSAAYHGFVRELASAQSSAHASISLRPRSETHSGPGRASKLCPRARPHSPSGSRTSSSSAGSVKMGQLHHLFALEKILGGYEALPSTYNHGRTAPVPEGERKRIVRTSIEWLKGKCHAPRSPY